MIQKEVLYSHAYQFLSSLPQAQVLGLEVVHATRDQLVLAMPYQEAIVGDPESGVMHGGAITTLMDTAAGVGVVCALPELELCPTLDLRVDYMRPGTPGKVIYAKATCERFTSSIVFMRVQAYQEDCTIAHCVATFMRVGVGAEVLEDMHEKREDMGPIDMPQTQYQKDCAIDKVVAQCRDSRSFDPIVQAIPYAQFIGFSATQQDGEQSPQFKLEKRVSNIGNTSICAIHGGVIGGFMELSAGIYLMLEQRTPTFPKIIDFSLDYLRAGTGGETFAECAVTRQGARVANVEVKAWQDNPDRPIALARAHFLLDRKS